MDTKLCICSGSDLALQKVSDSDPDHAQHIIDICDIIYFSLNGRILIQFFLVNTGN